MDLTNTNRQWLKDVPFASTRFAIREEKEKLRVLGGIAACLEDVSDVENSLSKSLGKVRTLLPVQIVQNRQ
jgi:hypothetical protein